MDLRDILSIAIASLIVLVVTHIAVFWVVRTLYPPPATAFPAPAPVPAPVQPPSQVFTQPAIEQQESHVHVPTYETPVQLEAAREEGAANFFVGPSASAARDSGLAAPKS